MKTYDWMGGNLWKPASLTLRHTDKSKGENIHCFHCCYAAHMAESQNSVSGVIISELLEIKITTIMNLHMGNILLCLSADR